MLQANDVVRHIRHTMQIVARSFGVAENDPILQRIYCAQCRTMH